MRYVALMLVMAGVPVGCARSVPVDARLDCPGGESCPRTALQVQAANGARRDATLRSVHFDDGDYLNSLGRAKLDAMLGADRVNQPLKVYIDAPGFEGKKAVVTAYLKDKGAVGGQFAVMEGANPEVTFPAGPQIASLSKTDSGPAGQGAGGNVDAAAAAPYGGAGAVGAASAALSTVGSALQAISK